MPFFTFACNVAKYLGYFCKELCSQELSKIAQSGHTVARGPWAYSTKSNLFVIYEHLAVIYGIFRPNVEIWLQITLSLTE